MYLYHYTNPRGSNGILSQELIRVTEADSKFAWFGRGVYMTALSPSVGRKSILFNNHRKTDTHDPNLWAKTSIYFEIDIRYLPGAKKMSLKDGRDVWVYRKDIDLSTIPYKTGFTDKYVNTPLSNDNRQSGGSIRSNDNDNWLINTRNSARVAAASRPATYTPVRTPSQQNYEYSSSRSQYSSPIYQSSSPNYQYSSSNYQTKSDDGWRCVIF